MRNSDIITLINNGLLYTTAFNVDSASAYKLYKLKKAVENASEKIRETEKGLVKDAGIDQPEAFDERMRELNSIKPENLTDEQKAELDTLNKEFRKYTDLRIEMYNDTTDLDDVKPVPYDTWFTLQKENKEVTVPGNDIKFNVFSGPVESILEGVFWNAPEE